MSTAMLSLLAALQPVYYKFMKPVFAVREPKTKIVSMSKDFVSWVIDNPIAIHKPPEGNQQPPVANQLVKLAMTAIESVLQEYRPDCTEVFKAIDDLANRKKVQIFGLLVHTLHIFFTSPILT
jgi:hypothetical protein